MKSIFRMPGGDVRWGWKAAILVVGTLLFGIVLNAVLTIVLIAVYSSQGLAPDHAMEQASNAPSGFMPFGITCKSQSFLFAIQQMNASLALHYSCLKIPPVQYTCLLSLL